MAKRYDLYDESGQKIGSAEQQPSAAEQVAGAFILFWLVWQFIKGIFELIGLLFMLMKEHPKITLVLVIIGAAAAIGYYGIYLPSQQRESQALAFAASNISATQDAQIQNGLTNLNQYIGIFQLGKTTTQGSEYVTVTSINFEADGIKVYFDGESTPSTWYNTPDYSCVVWESVYANSSSYNSDLTGNLASRPVDTNYTQVRVGDTSSIESGATLYHFNGYLVYPRSILPASASAIGSRTEFYFNYGCSVTNPMIPLFNAADFGS